MASKDRVYWSSSHDNYVWIIVTVNSKHNTSVFAFRLTDEHCHDIRYSMVEGNLERKQKKSNVRWQSRNEWGRRPDSRRSIRCSVLTTPSLKQRRNNRSVFSTEGALPFLFFFFFVSLFVLFCASAELTEMILITVASHHKGPWSHGPGCPTLGTE